MNKKALKYVFLNNLVGLIVFSLMAGYIVLATMIAEWLNTCLPVLVMAFAPIIAFGLYFQYKAAVDKFVD